MSCSTVLKLAKITSYHSFPSHHVPINQAVIWAGKSPNTTHTYTEKHAFSSATCFDLQISHVQAHVG